MAQNYGTFSGYTNESLRNSFSGGNNSGFGPGDPNVLFNQIASNNTLAPDPAQTNHTATQGQQNPTGGGTTSQTSTTTSTANARPFKKRKSRKKKTDIPAENSTSNEGREPTTNTTASDPHPSSNRPRGEATTFQNEENPNLSVSGNRPSLPNNLMSSLQNETLLGLRIAQNAVGQNKRITNQIKDQLKELTLEYQRKIHLLALEHKIRSELLFKWVGVWNKVRGPNRFNNFCRYAAEARKLFDSKLLPPAERMQQVAERWRQLDEDEQLKYNDWDFINSLREKMGLKPVDDPEEIEDEDQEQARELEQDTTGGPKKTDVQVLSHCKAWAKKTVTDMNFFSTQYSVESFLVLASTDIKGRVFITGSSFLGADYMQLLSTKAKKANDNDPWRGFRVWAAGLGVEANLHDLPIEAVCKKRKRTAIEVTTSNVPRKGKGPWDTGLAKTNKSSMTTQLKEILAKASNGVRTSGWPGEKAREVFKNLKLKVNIAPEAVKLKEEDLVGVQFKNTSDGKVDIILEAIYNKWLTVIPVDEGRTNLETTSSNTSTAQNLAASNNPIASEQAIDPNLNEASLNDSTATST
ncbi:hypothetical protein PGTUg99_009790 [Puccinia graminis f. sp. tritici]|uniref:Uncharacterized protein n=2 Tax=Puccinia graminis f. sp. tritici TaxID=56615 RepID=E3K1H9_PUCGT|nr:uncharacterized protein PGTG_04110 [Puccinia graminis f. sp. tritici CRL 75-36-700-3]EFP78154.2 hypothetical protein PGTG_04110 [Puccinia graminis f. sp. tritici CRL 75-36-700-3]KAA1127482.1 hypothetical protein PGTUg99_037163 [Puccinia graminis f. sp. tritici]KAA1130091.1 hypothetical protein PGTUg99_009790 [Puccinia graminis f. sp. tritici]